MCTALVTLRQASKSMVGPLSVGPLSARMLPVGMDPAELAILVDADRTHLPVRRALGVRISLRLPDVLVPNAGSPTFGV